MSDVFIGTEMLSRGALTRGQLRWNYSLAVSRRLCAESDGSVPVAQHPRRMAVVGPQRRDRRAWAALDLMDPGAQSPKETWLRLLLVDAGLPAPRTQVRVTNGANEAFIDMGYDEPMVGLDYDGQHHSADRGRYVHDIGRAELIERAGWIDIHVVAEHGRRFILHRVSEAFARRGYPLRLRSGS